MTNTLTQLRIDSAKALGYETKGNKYFWHAPQSIPESVTGVWLEWAPDKEGHEAQLVELFAWLGVKAPYKLTDAMFHLGKLRSDWKLAVMSAVAEVASD